jgi:hypothetical protein
LGGWLRRAWRGSVYAVGGISRNVNGYYGSHYGSVAPDPVPGPTYVRYIYAPVCWSREPLYRYWVC